MIYQNSKTSQSDKPAKAALATLIILQTVMLAALFAQSVPHPPATILIFAIAPYLAMSLATAACALILGPLTNRTGQSFTVGATLLSLISFGPHKWFDPQLPLIWPAVIMGQLAAITLFVLVYRAKQSSLLVEE